MGHRFIDRGRAHLGSSRESCWPVWLSEHPRPVLRRKLDQNAILHVSNGQIVRHQGTLMMPAFGEYVLPEKTRRVANVEKSENRWTDINLRGNDIDRLRGSRLGA